MTQLGIRSTFAGYKVFHTDFTSAVVAIPEISSYSTMTVLTKPTPQVRILPTTPEDYYAIAALEVLTFATNPISIYGLGPLQLQPASLKKKADGVRAAAAAGDNVFRMRKAIIADEHGRVEIVGVAMWNFFPAKDANVETNMADKKKPGEDAVDMPEGDQNGGQEAAGKEVLVKGEKEDKRNSFWPEGANVQLCEDVFIRNDNVRESFMAGRVHALLSTLVVDPAHQGQGIGTRLINQGLAEVDRLGIRVWLGSTDMALPLYRKVGFCVEREFRFGMKRYGGSTVERHTLMWRPLKGNKEGVIEGVWDGIVR